MVCKVFVFLHLYFLCVGAGGGGVSPVYLLSEFPVFSGTLTFHFRVDKRCQFTLS